MKIIAYIRVSTGEQADSGAGLAAQRAAIEAEASRRGWAIDNLEFVEDAGFSAKNLRRPGLTDALDRLKAGEASVLLVSKMDRLSRSLLDFASIMQRAQREGWALVALDSPADLTTPSGEAMAGVMAVFAQLERRLIGERTKAALAQRKAAGVKLGRPRIVPSAVVEQIVQARAAGFSYRAIAETLTIEDIPTAQGGARWHASTVRAIVQQESAAVTTP
jgi:DNA invertase Pin-like site-specific DNA recombinase